MHKPPLLTSNFTRLQAHDEQILRLGMLAERYFPDDPNTSLLKLRQLPKLLAQLLATKVGLYQSPEESQYDFDKLALQRKMIWETCIALVHEIQHLMQEQAKSPGAAKKACIEEKMKQLADLASCESVCSSAAIACLQKSEIG
jgi:hypothetical protein